MEEKKNEGVGMKLQKKENNEGMGIILWKKEKNEGMGMILWKREEKMLEGSKEYRRKWNKMLRVRKRKGRLGT